PRRAGIRGVHSPPDRAESHPAGGQETRQEGKTGTVAPPQARQEVVRASASVEDWRAGQGSPWLPVLAGSGRAYPGRARGQFVRPLADYLPRARGPAPGNGPDAVGLSLPFATSRAESLFPVL